ncbi:hypothetical protein I3843_06G159600 [Carya illinoinensis]|nr:hypothetical protein I3843_06G159600 [Carya illinoinensis]
MIGNPMPRVSTCPIVLSPSLVTFPSNYSSCLPHFPLRSRRKLAQIRAASTDTGNSHLPSDAETKNPFAMVLDVPRIILRQTLRPLSDFGFGRRSIWEGGVGLFLVSGAVLLALSLSWVRGFQIGSKFRKYLAVLEFAQASGMCKGTPVRIRGVTVGNVIHINLSLKSIEAVVEVEDEKIIIPKNSIIEVNRSGLLMETIIDITPLDPIPTPSVGPLDPKCVEEGLIICNYQRIKGDQGISLDALVGIFTHLGRGMENIGIANSYSLAEQAISLLEEAKPLLTKLKSLAEEVQPLLAEVCDSGLPQEVEKLTRSLAEASEELRRVHSSIMTPENTELIQKSIHTLVFALKNIEKKSSDILRLMGDDATKQNLKSLIKSLSRML